MKSLSMTRNKGQVYSVGNYLMTGKVLGKGHFARVEEATHRVIGKKVAIKIIDLTYIKEDYAKRNLHREPRVMAKLRHPCIIALYETMMHGPRLYVVMEAATGGDLCAHVLSGRGATRGLPEVRAKALATQLVSAVRHMHSRGVVHRDLKMENIMLDSTKQFIKIVDFGLSNLWSCGGALRTPCGSLEYAAPELFVDGRKYGPEVDLWSIGVIVFGMVTGGLPFTSEGEGHSRPQLRAAISKGLKQKQLKQLACVSMECKTLIEQLLEPRVELRLKIEEASRHRWLRRQGMRMKLDPLPMPDSIANREIYRQIAELSSQTVFDVVAQIKAEPFGAMSGIYNIKTHLHQLNSSPGHDLLWASLDIQEKKDLSRTPTKTSSAHAHKTAEPKVVNAITQVPDFRPQSAIRRETKPYQPCVNSVDPRSKLPPRVMKKSQEIGDCFDPRLPIIDEHSHLDFAQDKNKRKPIKTIVRNLEEERLMKLNSATKKAQSDKRLEFYRRGGDGLPSWRSSGPMSNTPAKLLLQNNATSYKRASLGNIVSPNSSTNSHCKSERAAAPAGWYRSSLGKDAIPHVQRFRRSAMK